MTCVLPRGIGAIPHDMIPGMRARGALPPLHAVVALLGIVGITVVASPPVSGAAAPGDETGETRLEGGLTAVGPATSVEVRRWEYVILLRTAPEVRDALGRAQLAAFKAGGAVLDDLDMEATASHADYRLLVRTRDPMAVHEVVKAMRATRGVLGASATALPETPTFPGGPSFFESYTSDPSDSPSNADRVLVRHDVPPVADKRELLEMADVLAPPSTGPDGAGGLTMNVSELFSRIKEGAWRRREERLRSTPIEILPPANAGSPAPAAP